MTQYIDKDAVVAEIERLQDSIKATAIDDRISKEQAEAYKVCVKLRSFVEDTLEVKEADIGDAVHGTVDFPLIGYDFPNIYPNYKELKEYCDRKGIKDNDKVKFILIKDM